MFFIHVVYNVMFSKFMGFVFMQPLDDQEEISERWREFELK